MDNYPYVEKYVENENILSLENVLLLASTLILAFITDYLMYGKPFGVSYPIFIVLFYAVFLWNNRKRLIFKLNFGWLLSIPVLMLSLTYLIYSNEIFRFLNFFVIPVLIIAQALLITDGNEYMWYVIGFIKDIICGFIEGVFAYIPKPFQIGAGIVRKCVKPRKNSTIGKILIGLLISVPLLIIIVSLLASADMMFKYFFSNIMNIFDSFDIYSLCAHFLFVLLICIFTFSFIWNFSNRPDGNPDVSSKKTVDFKKVWDPVVIITVLVLINIIYLVFTAIQFTYLFGGVTPHDFSYSEYARRGFFELVAVTLINLSILLCNINFTKDGGKTINILNRILNSLLVICTIVMLYSAHLRMFLYEETYGYTYLRVLTHAFMLFIFVLLAATLIKVWNEKMILLRAYVIIALIAYVAINYANVDAIIARNNVERYNKAVMEKGKNDNIDINYIGSLSYDAVPILAELTDDKNSNVSDQVKKCLYGKKKRLEKDRYWQSFNISKDRAGKTLEKYDLKP